MKKYFEKLKDLKSTNKKLYVAILCLFAFVGITFAYVAAQLSGGAWELFNATSDISDSLIFDVDKKITITANKFNFYEGAGNLFDTATATAKLRSNSTNESSTFTYNVYFIIENNEFRYTTDDKKTEILLQITDPNGNNIKELDGLTYDQGLQGFDITEATKAITIAKNYVISSNSSTNFTVQDWSMKVTFINLDTDQQNNEGKTLSGRIVIQRKSLYEFNIALNSDWVSQPSVANISCDSGNGTYDKYYKKFSIANFNDGANCNLTSESITKNYLNDYIINLSETDNTIRHYTYTLSSVTYDTGYRYHSKTSNNYIWFNDELWQIIGVVGEYSHGNSGEQLVKIVRVEPLIMMWDNQYQIDWNDSSSKILLNEYYYNKTDASNTGYCVETYNGQKGSPSIDCDFSNIGIKENYRKMIRQATWYLGSRPSVAGNTGTFGDFYKFEKSSVVSGNSLTARAYVGIPYVSDFCWAYPNAIYSFYIQNSILKDSWLNDGAKTWTIAYDGYTSSSNNGIHFVSEGVLNSYSGSAVNMSLKPTLYLNKNVYLVDGNGTKDNPYIIAI